jgi:hypothetical protein
MVFMRGNLKLKARYERGWLNFAERKLEEGLLIMRVDIKGICWRVDIKIIVGDRLGSELVSRKGGL